MTAADDATTTDEWPRSILVEDRVRQRRVPVTVAGPMRAGTFVERFVRDHSLPLRTLDGDPITYVVSSADGTPVADEDELGATVERIRLDSEVASSTWRQVSSVVAAIEAELGTTYRADAKAAVEDRVDAVREHLRTEAMRQLRGVGSRLDWRTRGRVRRLAAQLGITDAFPEQSDRIVSLVRVAGPLVGTATRIVAPIAVVGAAAAGGGLVGANLGDGPGDEPSQTPTSTASDDDRSDTPTPAVDPPTPVGPVVDVDAIADAVVERLPVTERLTPEDLAALLGALVEADPATAPVLGGITADPPTQLTAAGGSLWAIAEAFRDDLLGVPVDADRPDGGSCGVIEEYAEPIGTYVLRVWAANLDVVGADPDLLEVGAVLRMPCPR